MARSSSFPLAVASFAAGVSAFCALSLAPSHTRPAQATVALPASLRQLTRESTSVVAVTPGHVESRWEEDAKGRKRIVTYTEVKVEEAAFGHPPKTIWVRTLGGRIGDVAQRVVGEAKLVPGKKAVLFLHKRSDGTRGVVEMAQGHYDLKPLSDKPTLLVSPELAQLLGVKLPESAAKNLDHHPLSGAFANIAKIKAEGSK